jgi:hypothetical protein
MAQQAKHTPGPWDYVPSTEHHGPYVTSSVGNTICDCYVMSEPGAFSTASGGPSKPIPFLAEMADPNARLIAAAPSMFAALEAIMAMGTNPDPKWNASLRCDSMWHAARAAIKKATGE